jgi:site-specific DNA-methyltransferase (adenine-specific)
MIVITLARKPLQGTVGANVGVFGTGGLNIDKTRIEGPAWKWGTQADLRGGGYGTQRPSDGFVLNRNVESNPKGRWPANIILVQGLESVFPNVNSGDTRPDGSYTGSLSWKNTSKIIKANNYIEPSGGSAARFFKQVKLE